MAATGEALVAPHYVGLCGTDYELFIGSMPYFGEGLASYPVQPGHEIAGVIVDSPASDQPAGLRVVIDPVVGCRRCPECSRGRATRCVDRFELGVRGGMPGGAAELISVPTANLHPIPDELDSRDAVLVEPGVTALNAVVRLGEVTGRRSLVVGAGTLGLIAAQLLANRGAAVDVLAVEEARVPLIEHLGLTPVTSVTADSYDCVIEAAGAPAAVRSAVAAVAPGGGISLTGIVPRPIDDFDVTALVLKDVTVRGSLNGPGLYRSMLAELADGAVDSAALIEAEYGLEEADAALAKLATPARRAPKVILRIAQPEPPVT